MFNQNFTVITCSHQHWTTGCYSLSSKSQ